MLLAIFNELLGSVRGLSAVPMPLYLVLYRAIENGLPGMPDGDDIRMKIHSNNRVPDDPSETRLDRKSEDNAALVREPKAMIDDRSQRITLGFNLGRICLGEHR